MTADRGDNPTGDPQATNAQHIEWIGKHVDGYFELDLDGEREFASQPLAFACTPDGDEIVVTQTAAVTYDDDSPIVVRIRRGVRAANAARVLRQAADMLESDGAVVLGLDAGTLWHITRDVAGGVRCVDILE